MDLEGKHVVIIGGSSGMGLATAAGAAAAGAKVTIASSGQSRLDAALAALPDGTPERVSDNSADRPDRRRRPCAIGPNWLGRT
jgi:NAD(P)-dependent dehydrogenase (short-subunit alcohol dehydrogenase family)